MSGLEIYSTDSSRLFWGEQIFQKALAALLIKPDIVLRKEEEWKASISPTTPTPDSLPPNQKCVKKQSIVSGSPTLECPLVAKPGTSFPYFASCDSATRLFQQPTQN
ncbi:hypothetical protein P7K49_028351 [Saguinus oedipus]|uniref:Uncharacterized protein n=1 Tax=Saguinus oedipus TaxID=9490 RepID=A0ABQ9UDC8_SAGOE|nr:hypothetical protein P7K49_028351 [Saguinus oedipus]